ncbi:hypothetical protein ANCCAN_29690 [Ancylostoma caninum]|uniref:Uncharacterized protein n=1 Tax=Ancylostoma caninum TaxID=29170 RepID=A0A368EXU8_ANCCA|nr:hypothetical protein ANCCAN_29690 [Ancylostoma caninum]
MGRFNSIDFNYEYQEFRGTIDVADSDDMKLVVDKDDLRKLTARQRDITTDGLIRIPTAFRSAFKKFVLHIAGQQQGSEYSVKIDAILSSVVKESRRNYPGRRCVWRTEQPPDDAQVAMDEPLELSDL